MNLVNGHSVKEKRDSEYESLKATLSENWHTFIRKRDKLALKQEEIEREWAYYADMAASVYLEIEKLEKDYDKQKT